MLSQLKDGVTYSYGRLKLRLRKFPRANKLLFYVEDRDGFSYGETKFVEKSDLERFVKVLTSIIEQKDYLYFQLNKEVEKGEV